MKRVYIYCITGVSFFLSLFFMQTMRRFLMVSVALLTFIACTEVIEIDLNSSDPQVVVEIGRASCWERV